MVPNLGGKPLHLSLFFEVTVFSIMLLQHSISEYIKPTGQQLIARLLMHKIQSWYVTLWVLITN